MDTCIKLKVRKVQTRFMNGNIDVEGYIFDLLSNEYGMGVVCSSEFKADEGIYSDGFIYAIERGLIPTIELHPTTKYVFNGLTEYHHVIINDECYNVFFK